MLPPSVQDWLPAGHLVHVVLHIVREELDRKPILKKYDEERGYPPFHPAMMVALLRYAYSQGICSSRRIAKACRQRNGLYTLPAMQDPDFRTISLFR
jgi:transposase